MTVSDVILQIKHGAEVLKHYKQANYGIQRVLIRKFQIGLARSILVKERL